MTHTPLKTLKTYIDHSLLTRDNNGVIFYSVINLFKVFINLNFKNFEHRYRL